jgi:ribonucleoside-diphosphate reductase alpha chain
MEANLKIGEWQNLLNYFDNDVLAAKVWIEKYALKTLKGELLEKMPGEMHERMAKEFYRAESNYIKSDKYSQNLSDYGQKRIDLKYDDILNYFKDFKFLVPQGSVMANLGDKNKFNSLSNCVVLPEIFDSYGGILFSDQQLVQLCKRRCGVGIDISNLRPLNQKVKNSAGATSGAVSFMDRFSNSIREVAQHGRRGALMLSIDVRHPEIIDFIRSKQDLTKITGANISVKVTNDFMRSVIEKKEFDLKWPVESEKPIVFESIQALDIWNEIIKSAHKTAEPGILFWDQHHFNSTSSIYPQFKNISTNPCSEIAMQGGDSCRLMAINLYSFVKEPFTPKAEFDFEKLYEVSYEGMRLMDDLVDLELEHIWRIIDKIKKDTEPDYIKDVELRTWELLKKNGEKGRRTGLGFTGLADALAALGFKYDSENSLLQIDAIMRTKFQGEIDSTIDMAIQRGSFVGYNSKVEKVSDFVSKMMFVEFPETLERMQEFGRRNVSFSTVAPTGTLSLLTQTSSGIEPVYMLSYKRKKKVNQPSAISFTDTLGDHWEEFEVIHPKLKIWQDTNPEKSIEESPYFKSTSKEIEWERRIHIQKIIQKYTTHSISSTINLSSDVTLEKIGDIFFKAWEEGLKGVTIYRDGSRDGVLGSDHEKKLLSKTKRPKLIQSEVIRFKNKKEDWIGIIGLVDSKPVEIFTREMDDKFKLPDWVSKGWTIKVNGLEGKRYDFQYINQSDDKIILEGFSEGFKSEYWNYGRLISGMLRLKIPLEQVVNFVDNIHLDNDSFNSWKSGVSRALSCFIEKGVLKKGSSCPSCSKNNSLEYQEGCYSCINCGFTQCS